MKIKFLIVAFFQLLYTQAQHLEETIYQTLDSYNSNRNIVTLKKLTEQEKLFEKQVATKEEQLALVILQCNKAFWLKENNQYQKAIITYQKAWKRYSQESLSRYDIIEYCLKPLGNLYTKTKEYISAENTIKHYIYLAEKSGNTSHNIAGIINLSKLYQSLNRHRMVFAITSQALEKENILEEQRVKLQHIKANSSLFLEHHKEKDLSKNNKRLKEEKYLLYQEKLTKGRYQEAAVLFKRFKKDQLKKEISKREKAKLYLEEAQIFMLLKKGQKAKSSIDTVMMSLVASHKISDVVNMQKLYPESLLVDAFDIKAELENSIEKKLSNYDKSFYVSQLIERNTVSQQTKILLQSEKRNRSEKCISLLLEKYSSTKEYALLEKAFLYANIGKAEVLTEQLFRNKLLKLYPKNSLLIKEKELLLDQEKLNSKLVKEKNIDSIASINRALNALSIDLKNLQIKILEENFSFNSKKITLSQVQEKARKGKLVFVTYFYGKKYIYQFVINENEIKVHKIKITSKLEESIVTYIQLFNNNTSINNDIGEYTKKAFELYKVLNFDELVDEKNVHIVADGLLNFIPFETLLTKKANETFYSKMPFVLKEHVVSYSFTTAAFLQESNTVIASEKVLGFFPVFSNTLKELKYSLQEAEVIRKEFKATIFEEEQATKGNFIKNINKEDIIHLSTHSETTADMKSYIDFYDEKLYVNEVYGLECNASLVVLSACDTGVGTLVKGEGVMSVARCFNYIGVNNLLFSLWKINDKSTAMLMSGFYHSYKINNNVSMANHQSKINYLNNKTIDNFSKSPYYWGAFVSYTSNVPIKSSNKLNYVILAIVLLSVIFLFIVNRNKGQ